MTAGNAVPLNISILGAGAWGTAMAIALAERHEVMLWGRNAQVMAEMEAQHENVRYLPAAKFPNTLHASSDFEACVDHVDPSGVLIIGSSVSGLRPLLEQLKGRSIPNVIWLCKGLEQSTGLLPHQVVQQVLGESIPYGVLSGPSFAKEVALGLPVALSVASSNAELRERVVHATHGRNIRVYSTDDLVGVEIGGAVKNIMAIATGIVDGMGLGLNARAALMTRGLAEMTRLGIAMGGRAETFMGLAGVGDLLLTCTGDLSRNRRVGLELATGKSLDTIVAELGHVAEGVRCAQAVRDIAALHQVDMPITHAVCAVLFEQESPKDLAQRLLSRHPKHESH